MFSRGFSSALDAAAVHAYDKSLLFSYSPVDSPNPTPGSDFGAAMGKFDGVLVVGAPLQDVGPVTDRGTVFIVKLN